MKKTILSLSILSICILLLSISACKKMDSSTTESQRYTLTVSISTGVDGSPSNGSFSYDEGHVINYDYTLQNGYSNLQVLLDGAVVNATGTFTMNSNHTLEVTADPNPSTTFTLTVSVGAGVTGTPATGSYSYSNNDAINYSYSLANANFTNLQVTLDGVAVASTGIFTMDSDHTLIATADAVNANIDVRGLWEGTMRDANGDDDFFSVTFAGGSSTSGTTSGFVVDNSQVGTGTFTVNGNNIEFTLLYGNGTRHFDITGVFTDQNNMSGNWTWTTSAGQWTGTFTLVRQ